MLHSVFGVSDDIELATALEDVIDECKKKLNGHVPQLGILLSSCMDADFDAILHRIVAEFPGIQLLGCTTDGEINPQTLSTEDSLALLLLASDTIEFGTAIATDLADNAAASFTEAFASAGKKLTTEPVCGFILPDGLSTAGAELDQAIRQSTGLQFPVFGGTAGDHFQLVATKQFYGTEVYSDSAPILLLGGRVTVGAEVEYGPIPTGLLFPVGRSRKNIVYEIGGRSALCFYEEHLGTFNEHFMHFPLAVFDDDENCLYLRSPFKANRFDGSVTFAGNIPENSRVRLTMTSRNDLLSAANKANSNLLKAFGSTPPELVLVFGCASFKHVLGSKTDQLFERLAAAPVPFFGFFCYGELVSSHNDSSCKFLSDTYFVVGIRSS